jgi:hypothetical protein
VSSHAEEAEEAEKGEGFLRQSSASSAPSACQFFLRIRYDTESGKTISKGTERNREQPEEQRKKCESPLFLWLSSAPLYLNLCFLAFDVRLVFFRIWYEARSFSGFVGIRQKNKPHTESPELPEFSRAERRTPQIVRYVSSVDASTMIDHLEKNSLC